MLEFSMVMVLNTTILVILIKHLTKSELIPSLWSRLNTRPPFPEASPKDRPGSSSGAIYLLLYFNNQVEFNLKDIF